MKGLNLPSQKALEERQMFPNLNDFMFLFSVGVHRPSQTSDVSGFYSLPPSGVGQVTPSMGW